VATLENSAPLLPPPDTILDYFPHIHRVKGKGTVHPTTGHEDPEGEV